MTETLAVAQLAEHSLQALEIYLGTVVVIL